MKKPIVIIGLGQIGSVFAQGFLQLAHPVYPIKRGMDLPSEAQEIPDPALVLVAVREEALHTVLPALPERWRDALALIQNELLPRDWEMYGLPYPTVVAVWFEKRKGKLPDSYFQSPVYGPHADLIYSALQTLELPAYLIDSPEKMLFELVRKNLYIISKNIVGLVVKGSVGQVWEQHRGLFLETAGEVLEIQSWLAGRELPKDQLMDRLAQDIETLPDKSATGSSARARLKRAVQFGDQAGLPIPRLREILNRLSALS